MGKPSLTDGKTNRRAQVLASSESRENSLLLCIQFFQHIAVDAVVVAGSSDDDLLDLGQTVGCLDKVFQPLLGREPSHSQ